MTPECRHHFGGFRPRFDSRRPIFPHRPGAAKDADMRGARDMPASRAPERAKRTSAFHEEAARPLRAAFRRDMLAAPAISRASAAAGRVKAKCAQRRASMHADVFPASTSMRKVIYASKNALATHTRAFTTSRRHDGL